MIRFGKLAGESKFPLFSGLGFVKRRKGKVRKKGSGGFMIGEREGAWLVCHWVGGGTRRKGGRPAEFTSEIANMNTNEIFNCV